MRRIPGGRTVAALALGLQLLVAIAFLNCGDGQTGPGDPRSVLDVAVATTGEDLDPDGYAVMLDGAQSRPVGVNETVTFSGLTAGSHSVELLGLAPNCSVIGSNPATLVVGSDASASLGMTVTCTALTGDLSVSVSTVGTDLDPDGYVVDVRPAAGSASATAEGASASGTADPSRSQSVDVNGAVTFPDLRAGDYTVELTDLALNCAVAEPNPTTLSVLPDGTSTRSWTITCTALVGDLEVAVSTTGSDLDPDGYSVAVDGGLSQAVASNGSVTVAGLAEGDHSIELTGVAGNCSVSDANPRTVTVPFGATAMTAFTVTCASRVGELDVSATTTGQDLDPDGYGVSVDGGAAQAIGTNGSVTFTALPEGDHSIELTGVAGNCSVSDANPRTVTVPFGGTATTAFTVTCASRVGTLDVSATTTGQDLDPDGYSVNVDGGAAQPIGTNGSVTFTGLAEGDHTVELSGVANNCTVSGANPRTVTVPFDGTATTAFTVTCASRVGELNVSATTTGSDLDPDGYSVAIDGGPVQPLGINGGVTFTALPEGDHTVELSGIANNCTVSGANPRTVTVPFDGTATTAFTVGCTSRVGDLQITTTTTGQDLDPDGYSVAVDGGAAQPLGSNGSVTFTGLVEGDHSVELSGIAGNCTVDGANPRTVTVPFGGTATAFTVTCASRVGALDVTGATTGSDLDPDGYSVAVDGGPAQPLGTNGSVTFTGLAEGDHSVGLSGVANNCTVSGANPRTVTVPFDGTATTTFTVGCTSRVGDLQITTTTTGQDLDPDGYTVTVDGGPGQAVGINASVTFTGLAEGDHSVELTGVTGNCSVSDANPRTVTVPFGGTATTAFTVTCAARVGDLAVTAATTGSDLDPDGYSVAVDGGPAQPLGINSSVTFPGMAEGAHSVALSGIAGNCTVDGANPRTVTVPFAGTATTTFTITCASRVGDLRVSANTSGSDLDPDGYTVIVAGGPTLPVASNGSVTFTGLPEGAHSVTLSGVASNCTVSGANPRTVTVPFGGTAVTSFAVSCVARLGDLAVNTSTTGSDLDPDGYIVTVDGGPSQAVASNGSVTFPGLAEGDHSVELTGMASNCTLGGANPRTVTVPFGGTASTTFAVTCAARVGDLDVTAATTGSDLDPDGYTVTVDGGPSQTLAGNGSVRFTGLAEGDHSVALSGVAGNCTVSGANPRTVTVPYNGTASTAFSVACAPRLGDLDVTATTTGSDLDPDGYTVTVDGGPSRTLAGNGSVTFTGLAEGDHSVALTGIAGNCSVDGANPRTVTVPFDGTASTAFSLACVPRLGDLDVAASTTGSDLDPDGYAVTIDGGPAQPLAINDETVTFPGLAEGDHSVELTEIAGNCSVDGANPRTITVPFGGTATTTFAVTCAARVGDLDVTASTTGSDIDMDGYTVTIDGSPSQTVASNGSVTVSGLAEGDHTVELTGIAGNCSVDGANQRSVTVPFAGTATTAFALTCDPTELEVTISTSGGTLDPDGYTVTVDGVTSRPTALNDAVQFANLGSGSHSVALSGVAGSCTVVSWNPQTATVQSGQTASVAFFVRCGDQILVGAGDIASCSSSDDGATAAILDAIPGAVFTAGDNANPTGTTDEFTSCYDPTWGRHRTRTWPTPGNRDYNTAGAVPYFTYFGEAAGTPGEGWYSYDLGSWHVIALNTEVDLSNGSAQYNWLVSDLSASTAQCTVVYYHHPRFASTSANNKLVSADAWVAMYAAGVELVLNGHAQIYERFAPQAPDGTADPTNGIREIIVGTGGHTLHNIATIAPNSEVRDNVTFGVLVLTLRDGSYDWEFVPVAGGTFRDSGSGSCH